VIPSVFCANRVAKLIADQVEGAVHLGHPVGCSQVGEDLEITARTLAAMGNHPNLAAVLVVGLGCERFTPGEFVGKLAPSGKPVEKVVIQEEGDSLKTVERGVRIVREWAETFSNLPREPFGLESLIVGVKCGGTDATSGIAANPAVGAMSDLVVDAGGTVLFSEVTELLGAEEIMARRAVSGEVADRIRETIARTEEKLRRLGADPRFSHRGALISTGNFDGGVSSVAEKALGGIYKAGTRPIHGVVDYARRPETSGGVFLMDSPGHDGEVVTGLVGGGAQVIVFTTGRGTPTGFPFVPVVKVTGNRFSFQKMRENIDFDASAIISGESGIDEKGKALFEMVIGVSSGKKTKAEILKHDELFCITRV
jgi:altronate dehydratase large subunit